MRQKLIEIWILDKEKLGWVTTEVLSSPTVTPLPLAFYNRLMQHFFLRLKIWHGCILQVTYRNSKSNDYCNEFCKFVQPCPSKRRKNSNFSKWKRFVWKMAINWDFLKICGFIKAYKKFEIWKFVKMSRNLCPSETIHWILDLRMSIH